MSQQNSSETSPMSRFSGSDIDFFSSGTFDPSFTQDISNKMRVPKNIRVVGGHENEKGDNHNEEMNGNWAQHHRSVSDRKVQMQVPDRIIVTGQERHVGQKALPRELQLETVVMPQDTEHIRIQTPPRSITIQNAPQRPESENSYRSEDEDETLVVETSGRYETEMLQNGNGAVMNYVGGNSVSIARRGKRPATSFNPDENEEIEHLREQLSRINRRLLAVEEDTSERKERERYLVMAGLLYVAYKTCAWLFKGHPH